MPSKKKLQKEIAELKSRVTQLESRSFPWTGLKTNEEMAALFCSEDRQTFKTLVASEDITIKSKVVTGADGKARHWDEELDAHYFDGFAAQSVLEGQILEILVSGNVNLLEDAIDGK